MASGTIKHPYLKVGTAQAITLPFTPPSNGVVYAAGVATENNAYITLHNSYWTEDLFIPVKNWAGHKAIMVFKNASVTEINANVTNVSYTFFPFV